jgi:transposase
MGVTLEVMMEATYLLAIDLGKRHFPVCGTDVSGKVLFNRPLSRPKLMEFLAGQPRLHRYDRSLFY